MILPKAIGKSRWLQKRRKKTAFGALSSLYQFTKMPFDLHGATGSFKWLMDKILKGAVAYIDDILVFSNSWKKHLDHLFRVLMVLKRAGLVANQTKSV